jgi:hypothetical protein
MSSPRFSINWRDLASAARHTVVPLLAGAAVAAVDTVQSGQFDLHTAQSAAWTALVAGVGRLLHRWMADLNGGQG